MPDLTSTTCQHGIRRVICVDCNSDKLYSAGTSVLAKQFSSAWPEGVDGVTSQKDESITLPEYITKATPTPLHYQQKTGDIYDMCISNFGIDKWCIHAEMEVIQYIMRARRKDEYLRDIKKAKVILDRILFEVEKGETK